MARAANQEIPDTTDIVAEAGGTRATPHECLSAQMVKCRAGWRG